jgi:ApbE superfamily uncharacterized protein (UPF0280 family)
MGNARWKNYRVDYLETDLWIAVSADWYIPSVKNYSMDRILFYRSILDNHIRESPDFLTSLTPLSFVSGVHPLVQDMYKASEAAGTGPMSAVAGAVAEYICKDLLAKFGFPEVVVENGGDIFMKLTSPATISIYAGASPLSDKIGLAIKPEQTPLSVCCSSGTVGHSLSFGTADACMIACNSGALADAFATACCNEVKGLEMVKGVTELMLQKPDVISVVIIKDDKAGIGGNIEVMVL